MTDFSYRVPVPFPPGECTIHAHVVERPEITPYLGQKLVELIRMGYSREFEPVLVRKYSRPYRHPATNQPLPIGTVSSAHNPIHEATVRRETKRMRAALLQGGTITTICMDQRLMGYAEVGNSPDGGYNVREVIAALPRKNLGTVALYTALQAHEPSSFGRVVADLYERSAAQAWFKTLGFRRTDEHPEESAARIPDTTIRPVRYELSSSYSVPSLLREFEARHPWLQYAAVHDTTPHNQRHP